MQKTLIERSKQIIKEESKWNNSIDIVNRIQDCREAIEAVSPYGDHLKKWIIDASTAHIDYSKSWMHELLKFKISDSYNDAWEWLDDKIPTKSLR